MTSDGRIETARRRVLSLKKTLALASAGVFAVALGVARTSEAGAAHAARTHVQPADDGFWNDESDDGAGNLGPAQGTPQAQTGVS